jgi:hypothetical protein
MYLQGIQHALRPYAPGGSILNLWNQVSLPGKDGRIRGRVVRFECRVIPCAEKPI